MKKIVRAVLAALLTLGLLTANVFAGTPGTHGKPCDPHGNRHGTPPFCIP